MLDYDALLELPLVARLAEEHIATHQKASLNSMFVLGSVCACVVRGVGSLSWCGFMSSHSAACACTTSRLIPPPPASPARLLAHCSSSSRRPTPRSQPRLPWLPVGRRAAPGPRSSQPRPPDLSTRQANSPPHPPRRAAGSTSRPSSRLLGAANRPLLLICLLWLGWGRVRRPRRARCRHAGCRRRPPGPPPAPRSALGRRRWCPPPASRPPDRGSCSRS